MSRLLVTSFALRRSERGYVSPRRTSGSSLIEGQQQVDRLSVCLNAAPALPRAFMLSLSRALPAYNAMRISG